MPHTKKFSNLLRVKDFKNISVAIFYMTHCRIFSE